MNIFLSTLTVFVRLPTSVRLFLYRACRWNNVSRSLRGITLLQNCVYIVKPYKRVVFFNVVDAPCDTTCGLTNRICGSSWSQGHSERAVC